MKWAETTDIKRAASEHYQYSHDADEGDFPVTASGTAKMPSGSSFGAPDFSAASYLFDLMHLAVPFSILEGCVVATIVLAPAYSADLGLASSGTLYFVYALFCLVSPAVVGWVGAKWALVGSMFGYCVYIACYIEPTWETLIPASAVGGVCAACIWTAHGSYVTVIAGAYSETKGEPKAKAMGLFNGIANAVFQVLQMAGQFLGSIVLLTGGRTVLFVGFAAAAFLSSIFMCCLRPRRELMNKKGTRSRNQLLTETARLWLTCPRMRYMTLSNIAFGMLSGLQNGAYVTEIVVPSVGREYIGFVYSFKFFIAALVAYPLGRISDRIGRTPGMILGVVCALMACTVCLLWTRSDSELVRWAVVLALAALFGVAVCVWATLNATIMGDFYCSTPKNVPASFANTKLWSGLTTGIYFFVAPSTPFFVQVCVLMGVQVLGLIGYLCAARIHRSYRPIVVDGLECDDIGD